MEDEQIVALYWERNEKAIAESAKKYGHTCRRLAYNILFSEADAEECENDTYLRAWQAIPPKRPERLSAFLFKIMRHLALDRYDYWHAQRRFSPIALVMEELSECLPNTAGDMSDAMAFRVAFNRFLSALSTRDRVVFLQRYFYGAAVREIAKDQQLGMSHVKTILLRTRTALRTHLEKEGIVL